jgi:hypothetical protein
VESDPLELLGVLGEAGLAVLVPEEARVGEARGEDLAVAGDDHAGSEDSMLAVQTKASASLPPRSQTKYFWFHTGG